MAEAVARQRALLDAEDIRRAITRIAHEIVEANRGVDDLVLVGMHTRGVPLARAPRRRDIRLRGRAKCRSGAIDIGLYRDDLPPARHATQPPAQRHSDRHRGQGRRPGRRRALHRAHRPRRPRRARRLRPPARIQLAVLVDRGHRELPIRADYVGKNIPTSLAEEVSVRLAEIDGRDEVDPEAEGIAMVTQKRSSGRAAGRRRPPTGDLETPPRPRPRRLHASTKSSTCSTPPTR